MSKRTYDRPYPSAKQTNHQPFHHRVTMPRPRTKTLKRVFDWLENEMGLSIYGAARDRKTWEDADGGCMDYSLEDVLALHKAKLKGTIPHEKD